MAEFTRGQLKLAFSWHVARELIDADLEVAADEQEWLHRAFPRESLVDAGFIGPAGDPTPEYENCLGEALVSLPDVLAEDEKLALITTLFEGTLADDDFHHEEGNVLLKAARLLGLSATQLDAHLATMDEVGDLDDDLLEDDS